MTSTFTLTHSYFNKEKELMNRMFYTLLLSGIVLCADKPYQDTIVTSLPKPIIPFELSYYKHRWKLYYTEWSQDILPGDYEIVVGSHLQNSQNLYMEVTI